MNKHSQKNQNALRHGLYASDIVLPWENEADFTALFEEFMEEYRPQGPTERELVMDIARLRWLKRRLMRSAQQRFHEDAIATRNGNVAKGNKVGDQTNIKAAAKQRDEIRQTLKDLSTYISGIRQALSEFLGQSQIESMTEKEQALAAHKLASGMSAACGTMDKFVMPLLKVIDDASDERDAVELAYSADTLERIIRLEGMMDARFEKTLGRLLALQDMKRTINVKKIEQTSNNRKRVE